MHTTLNSECLSTLKNVSNSYCEAVFQAAVYFYEFGLEVILKRFQ